MARKDEILQSFLNHNLLKDKYDLSSEEQNMRHLDALNSEKPIIKSIALLVDELENSSAISDGRLYEMLTQYLNTIVR